MSESQIYAENLDKFKRAYPEAGNALDGVDCSHLQFCQNSAGQLNLVRLKGKDRYYYHSETDAVAEAREWVFNHIPSKASVAIVFGMGLGYLYDALTHWLHADKMRVLIILEDDLAVIKRFLETETASKVLADTRVFFQFFEMPGVRRWGHFRKQLDWVFYSSFLYIGAATACDAYLKWRPTESNLIIRQCSLQLHRLREMGFSLLKMRRNVFKNYYDNLVYVEHSSLIHDLKDKFKDIPALICGAGPSLQNLFDRLDELKDRVLIFGSGTAMNILTRNGFAPHFGIALDPNDIQESRYLAAEAYEIPYFFFTRFYRKASRWLQNPLIYVEVHSGANFFAWFNKKLNIEKSFKKLGRSSSTTCTAIAGYLGANPIVLTGMNLAYSKGARYAAGAAFYPATDINPASTKRIASQEFHAISAEGEAMETNWVWVEESGFYSDFVQRNPDKSLLNVTERGLQIPNVSSMDLNEISSRHFLKPYDLEAWIHAEMELANKGGTISGQILSGLDEWRESLKRCRDHYSQPPDKVDIAAWKEGIRASSVRMETYPMQERNHPIKDEPAYEYLLNRYEQMRFFLGNLEFKRLECHPDACDESTLMQNLRMYEKARYALFKAICDENLAYSERVYDILNARSKEASPKQKKRPKQSPDEHYSYEKGTLKLNDPEFGLDHEEQWQPDGRFELRYGSGKLKAEMLYKNGQLHGPSSFYKEDGGLLALTWFLDGKRVGKARFFDLHGNMSSLQRYRNGKRDGRQEYYYPDGTLRTLLEYRKGKLHGDVLLYYPNGTMKRSQHFVEGIREGEERLWNDSGLLVAEMEYRSNEPVGILRTWHSNGTLQKEVRFHSHSRDYDLTLWNNKGAVIKKETALPVNPLHGMMEQSESLEKTLAELKQKLERYEKKPKKEL